MNEQIREVRKITSFLSGVIRSAGLGVSITVSREGECESGAIKVWFRGPDAALLLANNAELLNALEHLTAEMLRLPPRRRELLCFDAADFRAARNKRLQCEAMIAVNLVIGSGRMYAFPAMSSVDRRFLLKVLQESGLETASAGIGVRRHVQLHPGPKGRDRFFEDRQPGPGGMPEDEAILRSVDVASLGLG